MMYQDILGIATLITVAIWIVIIMSFIFDGITWGLGRGMVIGIPLLVFIIREWKKTKEKDWE